MIPDSLLFQGDPVFFSYLSLPVFSLIILSSVVISLFLSRSRRSPERIISPISLPPLPDVDDPEFEERLAKWIRANLSLTYTPLRSYAHTAEEISHYAPEHPLVDILERLEEYEYTSRTLPKDIRATWLKEVQKVRREKQSDRRAR